MSAPPPVQPVSSGHARRAKTQHLASLIVSVFVFVLSLCFSAFYVVLEGKHQGIESAGIFLMGWLAVVLYGYVAWLANVALLAAWILGLLGKRRAAVFCAAIAIILGLSFLLHRNVNLNAGGVQRVLSYGAGFYLWIASMGVFLVGMVMGGDSRKPDAA